MKTKFFLAVIALALLSSTTLAQKSPATPAGKADPSSITGGVGLTWIDGKAYYLVSIAPELAFGKFGIGLDLNLRISSEDQKVRPGDFDGGRFVRYVRWGHKGDDIYARVGVLDYSKLGHGSIMYQYKNSPSYDDRRLGSEFDLNFEKFGFETVYGDFARAGVVGLRGYVKPMQFLPAVASIPIIGGLEIGATWASDLRSDSRDTIVNTTTPPIPVFLSKQNLGAMSVVGFDLGLPLLRIPTVSSTLYFDYAKIINFGSGTSLGLETKFSGMGILTIDTKLERRWNGDQYTSNYFNTFYELERYQLNGIVLQSKAQQLAHTILPGPGVFGDLLVDVLGTVQVRGTYSKLDNIDTSGVLHLGTSLGDKIPLVVVDAGYDKRNIKDSKDVFTLDERSLLYANVGYKPYSFMIVSILYTWTFKPVPDASGNSHYESQKQVTPKVSFVFPL
jgi:hypothetical protein